MIIILPSVPYQQGSRITVTTYPFCKEHLSFFLVQRAVDPFGSEVNQPWLSCATYSLLFAQSLHSLLLLFGLGFLWKRWTLILLRNLFQTERPGVLWLMGSQRVGYDWATELNWIILHNHTIVLKVFRATGWTEKARQGCFLMWNCYHSEVYCVVFLLWLNFIFYFRLDLLMSTLRLFL